MADENGVKKPPSVGPAPGSSTTPPTDSAKVDESFRQQILDQYFPPKEYTAPQWMSRMKAKNYHRFSTPEGDIEIRFQPNISADPTASILLQAKGLANPEEAVHFYYDFGRHTYICITDEQGAKDSDALSSLWLSSAKSYAGDFEDHPPSVHVESITLQDALDRIEYQMSYGNGLLTLEATLGHLWAYWRRKAEDATSVVERNWSGSMANHIQITLKVMTYGTHNEVMRLLEGAAMGCFGRWQQKEENAPPPTPNLELLTPLHYLVTAEMCYRQATCAKENAVRRGLLLKAEGCSKLADAFGPRISDTVATYASNLHRLVENGIKASPVTGSCTPVGMNVPGYGPTAASLVPLHGGMFLVRPLTPIATL